MDDEQHFLSRWSRRKLEAKRDAPVASPDAAPPAAVPDAPATQAPQPVAPRATSTGYAEFFDPKIDEELRQAALKGLFSDPHFNVMDGLDTYIDDYSVADPIPDAMLRRMNQAKELFLFDDDNTAAEGAGAATAGAAAAAPVAAGGSTASANASPARPRDDEAAEATSVAAVSPAQGGKDG